MKSVRYIAVAATAIMLSLAAPEAKAGVFIGLQQNGGAITTVASGSGSVPIQYNAPFGNFEAGTVPLTGTPLLPPPQLLNSTSISVNNNGGNAGTLNVYVTVTDIASPANLANF